MLILDDCNYALRPSLQINADDASSSDCIDDSAFLSKSCFKSRYILLRKYNHIWSFQLH